MKTFIKKILSLSGFEIKKVTTPERVANPYTGFDYAEEAYEALQITQSYSMMPPVNLVTLYEQAAYCEKNNIDGDFVECGVWKGGAIGMMALANKRFGSKARKLHLFDAFSDICEPDPEKDGAKALEDTVKYSQKSKGELSGKVEPVKGIYDSFGGHGTIEICNDLLVNTISYDAESIIYHKGWFQDTVPKDAHNIGKIAILRLDGDWYDSIKIPLNYLFDKVVHGGIIIIDDYGYYEGCTKAVDEFLEERRIKTFLSYSNIGCRYFVKC